MEEKIDNGGECTKQAVVVADALRNISENSADVFFLPLYSASPPLNVEDLLVQHVSPS